MQRPAGVDAEGWLRQCVQRAQQMPMDETVKAHYLVNVVILSGLTYNYNIETISTISCIERPYRCPALKPLGTC